MKAKLTKYQFDVLTNFEVRDAAGALHKIEAHRAELSGEDVTFFIHDQFTARFNKFQSFHVVQS